MFAHNFRHRSTLSPNEAHIALPSHPDEEQDAHHVYDYVNPAFVFDVTPCPAYRKAPNVGTV